MTDARLLATNPENSSLVPVACNSQGQLLVNDVVIEGIDNDVTVNGELTVTGDGLFAADVKLGDGIYDGAAVRLGVNGDMYGLCHYARNTSAFQDSFVNAFQGLTNAGEETFSVKADGRATFAGGKAGFTAEGHLWCTTRRDDTVILDATSGGIGSWQPYDPPTRKEQIKEQVEEWSEKDKVEISIEDDGET